MKIYENLKKYEVNMTTKDWVLLLVPICFNGIIIVLFQKFVLDKYIKHRMLKDEIVKTFLDMLKDLIGHMIQSNFDSMTNGDSINANVRIMQDKIVDVVKYYHINNYDLKKFKKKFDAFNNNWMSFQKYLNNCASQSEQTDKMRAELGVKIQNVFDSLDELIAKVRKKY